jgi:hypothetical protein
MLRRGLLFLVIPTLLSWILSQVLNHYTSVQTLRWPLLIGFFLALNAIYFVVYSISCAKKEFPQVLLVCLVLKLLISLIFLLIDYFSEKTTFLNSALHFLFYFTIFTVMEIWFILGLLKNTQPRRR